MVILVETGEIVRRYNLSEDQVAKVIVHGPEKGREILRDICPTSSFDLSGGDEDEMLELEVVEAVADYRLDLTGRVKTPEAAWQAFEDEMKIRLEGPEMGI